MGNMLTISNIYGHGYDEAQLEKLRLLGFKIRDQISRYAGSQILRFIDFPEWPYLEFIEVENESVYFDFLPKGMVPYCPGISLVIPDSSIKGISDFQQAYQTWGSYSIHVNYDGSDQPDKPGWNYLNFDVPVVRDTFIYLTKPDNPKPLRTIATDHANTAKRVIGLVFNLDDGDLAKLAHLVEGELVGGELDLAGIRIWSANALAGKLTVPKKQFPLAAIVIEVESTDFFQDKEDAKVFEFLSKPSVYIQTTDLSWDLIITTGAE
ncbi:MAG: hypothetical protein KDI62_19860 [Anaerolineae bacterium]|nr:hypothetical protein [Anaerolineae bacterium]